MSATLFYYVRPDESVMFAPVSGTVDADFSASGLTDGNPGTPAKRTGNPSWTIAPTAPVPVSLIAAVNHNVDAARNISISGDVTATLTPGTLPADGIPLNPFALVNQVNVSSMVVSVTSNSPGNVIIGELCAGKGRTLEKHFDADPNPKKAPAPLFPWASQTPPYDTGETGRALTGQTLVSPAGLADIEAWYASTRRGTRPTLIVPFPAVNDAWIVTFDFDVTYQAAGLWVVVQFVFTERPRTRW